MDRIPWDKKEVATTMDVQTDIKRVITLFTIGGNAMSDAQAVRKILQSLDILSERLNNPDRDMLRALYLGTKLANILPDGIRAIVREFLDEDLSATGAQQKLANLRSKYEEQTEQPPE